MPAQVALLQLADWLAVGGTIPTQFVIGLLLIDALFVFGFLQPLTPLLRRPTVVPRSPTLPMHHIDHRLLEQVDGLVQVLRLLKLVHA